ncbi:MAG TPA: AAA-like domain-containing protein [Candidatus Kapabacteria bacterium]|nr:AAA-like domain-containing protein [Candidatus Kapabacteria bacterium]
MKEKQNDQDNKTFRKPKRIFEDSGAVNPAEAYFTFLDHVTNTKNQDIQTMIDKGRYFSIFAPRQSGKTTFFKRLCDRLHQDRTYIGIVLSFQQYEGLEKSQFYAKIEEELYEQLTNRLKEVGCDKYDTVAQFLENFHLSDHLSFGDLFTELNRILQFKKIVIFIDEFDGIPRSELGNFLATLRDLYQKYKEVKQKALYSIALVGIRNITKLVVGGVSPFNIADQVHLPPFSLDNIRDLYSQYTAETNQPFTEAAVKRIHTETGGQPWLVNRLATILTVNVKPGTVEPIDEPDVEKALRLLLEESNDHFDNLYEKAKLYKETFVEIVFDHVEHYPDDEDQAWLKQYGLIKEKDGKAVVANPIYKERFIKTFFREVKAAQEIPPASYLLPNNRLDMVSILLDFSLYIARIGVRAFYEKGNPDEKTGQFLLTAWLYQFIKGGAGELGYEVVSGLGRMDVLLSYKGIKYIIETKLNQYGNIATVQKEGIVQLTRKYLATEAADEGYLVIFDTKTLVGTDCLPQVYRDGEKIVTGFSIGIGKDPGKD